MTWAPDAHAAWQLKWLGGLLGTLPQDHPLHAFHAEFPWAKLAHLVHMSTLESPEEEAVGLRIQVLLEGALATFDFVYASEGPHGYSIISLLPTYFFEFGDNCQSGLPALIPA